MTTLIILSARGDDRLDWDCSQPEQITAACAKFLELKKAGYLLFKVVEGKEKPVSDFDQNSPGISYRSGEQIHEFEPDVTIIASPPMAGG